MCGHKRYAGVAEWQTHLTQNQAGNTVRVQVPPSAPSKEACRIAASLFLIFVMEASPDRRG